MPKQKTGFLVFICSLIPGAGEMYMGLKKQGVSIMLMFWGIIAIASGLRLEFLMALLPIVWCYSFFNVHNLKSLSPQEFLFVEDDYLFQKKGEQGKVDVRELVKKYRLPIAVVLILCGLLTLWNCIPYALNGYMPAYLWNLMDTVGNLIPRIVIACCIIGIGILLIFGKKDEDTDKGADQTADFIKDKLIDEKK